ncbi:hypothetical protein GW17_00043241 [Ensete ventricosum]|nr:hypothetical protein GW17_00043241 [Ensete ventricosum]
MWAGRGSGRGLSLARRPGPFIAGVLRPTLSVRVLSPPGKGERGKTATMSGAGVPDFFYREAQRLGYVARSAFKVSPPRTPPGTAPWGSFYSSRKLPTLFSPPKVACQSLGPLEKGGAVVGIDLKVAYRDDKESYKVDEMDTLKVPPL